ncbi:MAG: arylsulfatase A-like enzyme [Glaciecola sp.]|jgi:arylsulfatase A-like enzyme
MPWDQPGWEESMAGRRDTALAVPAKVGSGGCMEWVGQGLCKLAFDLCANTHVWHLALFRRIRSEECATPYPNYALCCSTPMNSPNRLSIPARPLLVGVLLVGTLACGDTQQSNPATESAAARPNVLLISLDSVRADVLSCYGFVAPFASELPSTPNLDRLANEGARFERAYSSSSWTLPSHVALITGQPDLVHGVEMDSMGLSPKRPTLAEILAVGGYQTSGFYSGPYLDPRYGFGRGFDRYEAAYGEPLTQAAGAERVARQAVDQALALGQDPGAAMQTHEQANRVLELLSHRDRCSDRVTDRALDALVQSSPDQPWFLFAHYFDPHYDYVAPADLATAFDPDYEGQLDGADFLTDPRISVGDPRPRNPYRRRQVASPRDMQHLLSLYAAEVAWTDSQVGRLLDAIEQRGELDNTLVIVVSDHGDEFFEHGHLGHRINLFEESVRVPMLLRYPPLIPAGRVIPGPAATYDAFATILVAAGIQAPVGTTAQDLFPLINGSGPSTTRPLSRLVRAHADQGPEGEPLRTFRVIESYVDWPIKVLRARTWSEPAGPMSPAAAARIQARAQADRGRDLSLRWIDLAQHPNEPWTAWSTDFAQGPAKSALTRFQRLYPNLLRRRRNPSLVPKDQGQATQLQSLGYGGDSEPSGDLEGMMEYFTISPPGIPSAASDAKRPFTGK